MASPAPASSAEDGSLFASYERQYATTSTSVATALRQLQASGSTAEKVRQLEGQLKDAEMVLQRMDMEARSATPQSASMALVKKVKDYKRDHQTLLMDVRAAGRGASSRGGGGGAGADSVENRAELGLSGYKTEAQQQRDRMLTATDRLEQTGERIREGRKQLLETEVRVFVLFKGLSVSRGPLRAVAAPFLCSALGLPLRPTSERPNVQAIGEDVLSELQRQREAIERSRGAAADVRARTSAAESLVDRMSRWWRLF